MTGYVYAVRAGDRVKIGWSSDPYSRLMKIHSDCSFPARIIGVKRGDRALEKKMQNLWSHVRAHAEWFHATDSLLADIAANWVDEYPVREPGKRVKYPERWPSPKHKGAAA